ncbi:GNAT family N-acetyltransferase [Arthrobacter castelli]|uniref:GNAT family N-acetyltransferase n=1 Tax=Arthrobacter castelli TaxID=271431 RepID=UPI0004222D57|nr:GNAT family N-acetyltransferase [Arthrobacter castelli]
MNDSRVHLAAATSVPLRDLVRLYAAVGWTAYTKAPESLAAAISGSSYVITARMNGELVGLARAVSDNATICYIQDILVDPQYQRSGLGRQMVEAILGQYPDVRQKVLVSDAEPGQRAFYESLGFTEASDMDPPIRAFVKFDD